MHLSIDVPDDRPDLVESARAAWQEFNGVIASPFSSDKVAFGTTFMRPDAKAYSRPFFASGRGPTSRDRAQIILSTALLTGASDLERNLTILHECIHLAFAFGDHRERYQARFDRVRAFELNLRRQVDLPIAEINLLNNRSLAGFQFLQLPDEAVAELLLRRDYEAWFPSRATYYLDMRRDEALRLAGREESDALKAWAYFYADLRASLLVPMAGELPDVQRALVEAASAAQREFVARMPEGIVNRCVDLKPSLLDVSLDAPIDSTAGAYEALFDMVIHV